MKNTSKICTIVMVITFICTLMIPVYAYAEVIQIDPNLLPKKGVIEQPTINKDILDKVQPVNPTPANPTPNQPANPSPSTPKNPPSENKTDVKPETNSQTSEYDKSTDNQEYINNLDKPSMENETIPNNVFLYVVMAIVALLIILIGLTAIFVIYLVSRKGRTTASINQ